MERPSSAQHHQAAPPPQPIQIQYNHHTTTTTIGITIQTPPSQQSGMFVHMVSTTATVAVSRSVVLLIGTLRVVSGKPSKVIKAIFYQFYFSSITLT
jgi:hypothetical protein